VQHARRNWLPQIILTKQSIFKILGAFKSETHYCCARNRMTGRLYDPENIALETSLGYYLSKAKQALVERMDRALEPLDLTAQQIGVILLLSRGYARTPFELSRKMSYDSGSMTRMLDRLERKGLVARSRSEQDRRMIELTLTERGAEAARALPSLVANALNAQLDGFSADELVTLTGLLQRFIANGPGSTGCPKPDDEADS